MTNAADHADHPSLEITEAVERWLKDEVLPGHQAYLADPSLAITSGVMLARIKARHSDESLGSST
jgi:hypothetical protein